MVSIALIFALGSAVLFATYALLSRVLSKKSEDPLVMSILYGLYASVFSGILLFFEPWKFGVITPWILFLTFLVTVFFGIYQGAEFFARKHLEASRMTVIFQLTPVVTSICAIIFLGEEFSWIKLSAIVVIVFGNLIAIYKHGGHVTRMGLTFGLTTVIFLAFGYVGDKKVFQYYPLPLYVAITYFFPSLYAFLFTKDRFARIRKGINDTSWRLPVLSLISVFSYYFILKAFSLAEASVVIPVAFSSTILTSLGAIFILKEKSNIPQKLIGLAFVFAGVMILR